MDIKLTSRRKLEYVWKFIIIIVLYMESYYYILGYGSSNVDLIGYIHMFVYILSRIFFLYVLVLFLYVLRKVKYFDYILKNTKEISKGNFSIKLKEKGDMDLVQLAHNINLINKKYESAFEERIKDEKLKVEIINNFSNNLKFPLDSLERYIKLYKQHGISKEEKKYYIGIINTKTKKMKYLIEDLFEISKISSGKMELNEEEINIVDLIYQVIGELSFFHAEKNIKFIVNAFQEKILLNADGQKISKLMEILISNSLEYSLKNTRVYIDIERQNKNIIQISVKNVSLSEMNFNIQEIFKRYKNENCSMGLIMAKAIVELHGGNINVEKEADLFKVYITLKVTQ